MYVPLRGASFLLLSITVACSSGSTVAVPAEVTAEEACTAYVGGLCDLISRCAPLLTNAAFADLATCKSRLNMQCANVFKATGTSATPSRMDQCAKELATATCTDAFANNLPASCTPQPGTLVDGTGCGDDAQCQSTICLKKGEDTCGVCGKQPSVGSSCTGGGFLGNNPCGRGLTCANGTCVKQLAKGASGCDSKTAPCQGGLSCASGTCVDAATEGQKCDSSGATAPDCNILIGLFCNPTTKVCQKFKNAKAGEACGVVGGTDYAFCVGGSFCKTSGTTPPSGTCLAAAADGGACDSKNGPTCLAPARCTSGLCKLPDAWACK